VQRGPVIIPLEVKAGIKGQMQSLYRFLSEKSGRHAIRTSLENFSTISTQVGEKSVKVEVVPLYAIGRHVTSGR
jgi:hypothetical protein